MRSFKGSKSEISEKTDRFDHWRKQSPRIVALHTARAGSKAVPNKNLLECQGKPLFLHNLLFATQSRYIETVYASSDIREVLERAAELGCETIQRPPALAVDTVGHYEVIRHALEHMEQDAPPVDLMVVLLANNAGAYASDLDRGIEALLNDPSLDGVMSVSEFNMFNPFRAHRISEAGLIETVLPQDYIKSHQTNTYSGDRKLLGSMYFYNGSFWICRRDNILKNDGNFPWPWLGKRIKPIIQKDVMEVDEPWQVDVVRQVLASSG